MNGKAAGILISIAVLAFVCTGCATMLSGTSQGVTITSSPPGAYVKVGQQSGVTPVTLYVPKGKDYVVEVSQGPDKRIVSLERNVDGFTFLNIIPPLWPGFIVDAATGSIMRYDPDVVSVDFRTPQAADDAILTAFPQH
ncbi:MAG: PEGA domain-containing protein [Phycisphaerae bacterium]|jgi:hypothetical protein